MQVSQLTIIIDRFAWYKNIPDVSNRVFERNKLSPYLSYTVYDSLVHF